MKNFFEPKALSGLPAGLVVAEEDRRKQDRHIAMLRLAKIKAKAGEGWGFIKNLSATGMMVEVHQDFELGDTVSANLTEDQELTGKVRWRKDELAGIEFHVPIDVTAVLTKTKEHKPGQVVRLPRVHMKHPINLYLGAQKIKADICDISPAGICVRSEFSFDIGKKLRLSVPDLLDIAGTVRWQSDDRVGIAFSERLPLDDLMTWLSTFYQAAKIEPTQMTALSHRIDAETGSDPAADELPYQVIGHDDLGKEILIDQMNSASEALIQFKATSKFFYRVSIRNANDVELSIGTLVLRAFDEERVAVKTQFS